MNAPTAFIAAVWSLLSCIQILFSIIFSTALSIYLALWMRVMCRWPVAGELLFSMQFVALFFLAAFLLF